MTVYYTVTVGDDIGDATTYQTTQLQNLASIIDQVEGESPDYVELTISDGVGTVTVEVAT